MLWFAFQSHSMSICDTLNLETNCILLYFGIHSHISYLFDIICVIKSKDYAENLDIVHLYLTFRVIYENVILVS